MPTSVALSAPNIWRGPRGYSLILAGDIVFPHARLQDCFSPIRAAAPRAPRSVPWLPSMPAGCGRARRPPTHSKPGPPAPPGPTGYYTPAWRCAAQALGSKSPTAQPGSATREYCPDPFIGSDVFIRGTRNLHHLSGGSTGLSPAGPKPSGSPYVGSLGNARRMANRDARRDVRPRRAFVGNFISNHWPRDRQTSSCMS